MCGAARACGMATGRRRWIKILEHGELQKKLTVAAHAFSASARAKIEAAGWVPVNWSPIGQARSQEKRSGSSCRPC
jgi:large subunit ribosomal protein L15